MQYDVKFYGLLHNLHTLHPTLRCILFEKAYATIYHLFGNTTAGQQLLNPGIQGKRDR